MWQKVASQCLSRKYLFKALISKFFPLNMKNMMILCIKALPKQELGACGLKHRVYPWSTKKFTSNVLISGIWHAVWKLNEMNELFTPRSFFYRVVQSVWPYHNKNVKCKHLIVYLIIKAINKHWVGVWTSITIGY